ncbi:MAG: protein-L-isoaspartate(D-aspartate) O-methyltransferase [Sulfurovum sp.]|nr:protein-L-isoaspartate(D-aspartate) O-methyltransferase [Sulfurovum sp.]MCB4744153.1 protein-L-isoaspartate(D-aspartate) O-methyltransferase [Sulfurovum sp.]MCB4746368.1 protein-L-isoaspartate(D-aspartate) O-methyltransferase [Sulfurovum sp.]MCB4747642.1 protein-L-isoaspartate(D-aspartate) O-methyltransferase [Sulfurovum sp.]MCB4748796.1 protein-L-isoaspartate(D-aspartate) O-methyltransferase [Sulfurovum sp.]
MIKARNRQNLVGEIEQHFSLDLHVKKALLTIDREVFVPQEFKHLSYKLDALPLADSQWISSPLTVAKMTQHLELEGVDSVLEIGCGSGYQAAILSRICRRVFTIERIDGLLKETKNRFNELGIHNIFTRFDDGQRGWKQYAPFERILFSATAKEIPQVLFDQLMEGGILLAPIEQTENYHILTRFYKKNGRVTSETIEQCLFVPVLDGTQK